jgi:hypothetical protein
VQGDFVLSDREFEAALARLATADGLATTGPATSKEGSPGDVLRETATHKRAAPKKKKKKAPEQYSGVDFSTGTSLFTEPFGRK